MSMFNLGSLNFGSSLKNATRKRKVKDDEFDFNPDDIDFNAANTRPAIKPQGRGILGGVGGLAGLLQAISAGFGVGLSEDPGAALMQQLQDQRKQMMQQAQIAADERRQERDIQAQKQLEGIRLEGNRKLAGEERTFKSGESEKDRGFIKEIKELEFKNQQDRDESQSRVQMQLQEMQNQFLLGRDEKSQAFATEMEKLKTTGDIRQVTTKSVQMALLNAKANTRYLKGADIPMDIIVEISDKMGKGLPLTKTETDAVDRAFKAQGAMQQSIMRQSRGGGSGVGNRIDQRGDIALVKDYLNDRTELAKTLAAKASSPILDGNGQPVRDMTGKIQYERATPEEQIKYVQDGLAAFDAVIKDPLQVKSQINQANAPQAQLDNRDINSMINSQVDQMRQQGLDVNEIHAMIDSSQMNMAQKRQAKARANSKAGVRIAPKIGSLKDALR